MSLPKLLYALIIHSLSFSSMAKNNALKTYIIHVKDPADSTNQHIHYHKSFLSHTTSDQFLHSYKHVISGFSARLTAAEVKALTKKEGFISAHPEQIYRLSTTHSPAFLGLHPWIGLWGPSNQGKGAIIGVVDTGVIPTHPSFSDKGMMSRRPPGWKGKCEFPNPTDSNNKLIGARSFNLMSNVSVSPTDDIGHGMQMASTAAGAFVQKKIKAYIHSTKSPTATILFRGTLIGDPLAPSVTAFSSRGPSFVSPGILKPDIIGPGVNILSAWPFSFDSNVKSKSTFVVASGTSLSTHHLSGVAALLKTAHPKWSPAMIKSAIMTTADTINVGGTPIVDETLTPADVFATGAGHSNPTKANDPGLVYDITTDDYIPYLCGLGYTDKQVEKIVHKSVNCKAKIPEGQLNYPTFSASLGPSQTFTRTVTNVGVPVSNYWLKVVAPYGVKVVVKPLNLLFTRVNQKATYSVTFSRSVNHTKNTYSQGYLQWISSKHSVRSVISGRFTAYV